MKVLAVLVCSLAWSSAQYWYTVVPYAAVQKYTTYTVPFHVSTSTQYHAQDTLGQFAFHHAGDNQVRTETKSVDGSVRGLYGYVDPNGKLINVHYVADDNGFRVIGANNLPEAPSVPAEVSGPEPVKDTPEVVAARAAFQKSYEEAAKAASASPDLEVSRKKRQAVFYPSVYSLLTKSKVKVQEFEPVEGAAVPADTKKAEIKEKEHEIYTHSVPVAYSPVVQPVVPSVVVNPAVVPTVVKAQDVVAVEAPTPADTEKVEVSDKAVVTYSAVVPHAVSVVSHPVVSPVVHVPHVVYI
ncbi:hypothetical protein L9F63_022071 [Diploptera punctata]|uniref:Cuticle protein n=1 Tax=Diploptera punctata TaxID=6984 RepID=A0AAD7ZPN0_DIPPU|nr:hypothetical protein L9F63_022071 [Diploptera punctata]